jgi:hypothetical protein
MRSRRGAMMEQQGEFASYQFDIHVDHNQLFLEDDDAEWGDEDLDLLYSDESRACHLGATTSRLSLMTAKWYGTVRLEVILRSDPPDSDFTGWDNVAEASIEIRSGCLAVSGPETYETGARVRLPPGTYRVRVYAGGIETVKDLTDGQDHYRVVMWPGPYQAPALLHAGIPYPW